MRAKRRLPGEEDMEDFHVSARNRPSDVPFDGERRVHHSVRHRLGAGAPRGSRCRMPGSQSSAASAAENWVSSCCSVAFSDLVKLRL